MIFIQAAGHPAGPAAACFESVLEGHVELWLSAATFTEVQEVLSRRQLQRSFPMLTPTLVEEFCHEVERNSAFSPTVPQVISLSRDPKDEPYLNLAIAVNAEFLVTRDRDMLDLMKDAGFRRQFPGLNIVEPVAFLRTMSEREESA